MSKGLEALERMFKDIEQCSIDLARADLDDYKIIEKELKELEIIKKCFYVAKSSGAILLTDYGFEHKEELKEVLK